VDGNPPSQSKHTLLTTWSAPKTVHDVAKFIGFAQFYSRFIHNFELCVAPLCEITKQEYTNPLAQYWSNAAQNSLDAMKNAILANPCVLRFDYLKLIVLQTKNFRVLVSVGFYASQETTRRPIRQCRSTVWGKDSIS
jgi:hypothetical protein